MDTKSWRGRVPADSHCAVAATVQAAVRQTADHCMGELQCARRLQDASRRLIAASKDAIAASRQLMASVRGAECLQLVGGLQDLSITRGGVEYRIRYSAKASGYPGSAFVTVFSEYGEHTVWVHGAKPEEAACIVFDRMLQTAVGPEAYE